MNDPYEILEIDKNASFIDIKKSYVKLVKKYHPDKNNDENANEKFINIQKAYKKLSNKKSNNLYLNILDDLYKEGIFSNYINLLYNNSIYNYNGENNTIVINCSLEEMYIGCVKTINYNRRICNSHTNQIIENKTIKLTINQKNYNNQKIIYKNFGDGVIYNKPCNDLIIIINEEKHHLYKRINDDLIIEINLSLKEAITCNTTIKIPLLNDNIYEYKINKIINYNDKIKINNYGFNNNNLILIFKVFIEDLNNHQIEMIKNIL